MSKPHRVVFAREYTVSGEKRTQWVDLGVAFPTQNGTGFRLALFAIPAPVVGRDGSPEYQIMLFPPSDKPQGQSSGFTRSAPGSTAPVEDADDIPF